MDMNIDVNFCGNVCTVPRKMFENGPSPRLTQIYREKSSDPKFKSISINRPIEGFLAILSFYQTGELHMPMTSCAVAFLKELEYWEISPDVLSDCCYNRLRSYLSDKETVQAFKEQAQSETSTLSYKCLPVYRAKIWEIVEYTKPSFAGKVYFMVTCLMVLVSILVMAYSTDPNFQRPLTNCERLDYVYSSRLENETTFEPDLKQICAGVYHPEKYTMSGNSAVTWQQQENQTEHDYFWFLFQEQYINNATNGSISDLFNNSSFGLNFTGQVLPNSSLIDSTVNVSQNENISDPLQLNTPAFSYIKEALIETTKDLPNLKARIFVLIILDGITTLFFTIDILIRLSTCPSLRGYFVSVINCADLVSLLGMYAFLGLYLIYPHLRYGSWIDYLSYIQMLRSLRFLRIVFNVRAGKVIFYSVRKNIKDLSILVLFIITGMVTFASCFYIAEDRKTVESIPDAWYWAVITMTTVGYGDIQPQSKAGRLIACACSVSGVLILALTVPIFANHFLILYQYTESENIVKKYQKRQSKRQSRIFGKSRGR